MFIVYENEANNEVFVTTPDQEASFLAEYFKKEVGYRSLQDYDMNARPARGGE